MRQSETKRDKVRQKETKRDKERQITLTAITLRGFHCITVNHSKCLFRTSFHSLIGIRLVGAKSIKERKR